jgi:predicted lipoprotein with Yx(FWY)xxD motif
MTMRRLGLVALVGAMAVLSACAKSTTSAGTSPSPTATAAPSASEAPSPSASPVASASTSAAAGGTVVVHTGTATVSGKSEPVLTTAQGFTLYYHSVDTPTSVCSGPCAVAWPPLLLPSGTPTSSGSLPGTLAVVTNVNGRQVTYNGHLLYGWKNDTSAGQATGEGINNFHVVTPTTAGM